MLIMCDVFFKINIKNGVRVEIKIVYEIKINVFFYFLYYY